MYKASYDGTGIYVSMPLSLSPMPTLYQKQQFIHWIIETAFSLVEHEFGRADFSHFSNLLGNIQTLASHA